MWPGYEVEGAWISDSRTCAHNISICRQTASLVGASSPPTVARRAPSQERGDVNCAMRDEGGVAGEGKAKVDVDRVVWIWFHVFKSCKIVVV